MPLCLWRYWRISVAILFFRRNPITQDFGLGIGPMIKYSLRFDLLMKQQSTDGRHIFSGH